MKRPFYSCWAFALMVLGTPLVHAQDGAKKNPPVVVSFSGYGELKRDLESLGAL